METEQAPRWSYRLAVALVIATLVAIRLFVASRAPLSFDEAYYWGWSKDLSHFYPDHPPMVAWLIRAGTTLCGHTALGVRFFFVMLGGLGLLCTINIGQRLGLAPMQALTASVTAWLLPAVAAGTLLATPDVPLAACWLLATWLLLGRPRSQTLYGIAAIAAIGLFAKLSALLILPLGVFALWKNGGLRPLLRSPHTWLALLLFLVLTSPYLLACPSFEDSPFGFQAARLTGTWTPWHHLAWPLRVVIHLAELLGGYIALLGPLIALAFVAALVQGPWPPRLSTGINSVLIPLAAASVAALFTHPEQNWAALGHPVATLIAFKVMYNGPNGRWGKILGSVHWRRAVVWLTLLVGVTVHLHAVTPFLPLESTKDPISKMHGWANLEGLHRAQEIVIDAVHCDNYALASQYAWHNRDTGAPPVNSPDRPGNPLPAGTWLILDQLHDIDGISPTPQCIKIESLAPVVLKDQRGRALHNIAMQIGFDCR